MIKHRHLFAILGCATAVAAAGTGAAVAADGATDIKVTAVPTLTAGRTAPFDAPGVRRLRRGKPSPARPAGAPRRPPKKADPRGLPAGWPAGRDHPRRQVGRRGADLPLPRGQ